MHKILVEVIVIMNLETIVPTQIATLKMILLLNQITNTVFVVIMIFSKNIEILLVVFVPFL